MPRTHSHTHSISIEESPFTDAGVIIVDNWENHSELNLALAGSTVIGFQSIQHATGDQGICQPSPQTPTPRSNLYQLYRQTPNITQD